MRPTYIQRSTRDIGTQNQQTKVNRPSRRRWSFGAGILPTTSAEFPRDILAGITLATLAIPEVMGYTRIARTPVITGLFTILLPMALYAFFGSSRHLVVAADSATAAVLAAGLVGIAAVGSEEYVAYAGVLALMAAGMLIIARLAKLGFLADFLSKTVLIGFLSGVGIQIAITQIPDMLGISAHGGGIIPEIEADFMLASKANLYAVIISVVALATIFGVKRFSKRAPVALSAVVAIIVISYWFNLPSQGVPVLGPIPSGLPSLSIPDPPMSWNIFQRLLPTAISMFVIILAQSAATSRAYADRYSEAFDENQDLVGLGIANIGAAFTGTFVVNGSPTKTEMVDSAGGRSQIAQLTTVCITLAVLFFLTGSLSYMPIAVLAAIVFVIGTELVNVREMRTILAQRPSEFWIALLTAGTVVFVGVEQGIILAMVLSLLDHTRRGYRPNNTVLSLDQEGHRQSTPVSTHAQLHPGLVVYRFNHSMYYANCEQFKSETHELATSAHPPLVWLALDFVSIDDVDFSAAQAVRETHEWLRQRGVRLTCVEVQAPMRAELDRYGITPLIGTQNIFGKIHELENGYKEATATSTSTTV